MRIFPKQITADFFEYTSHLSVEDIRNEIETLLIKTKGFNFSINLTGKFTNQYEFKVTAKWQIAVSSNIPWGETNIKGFIFKNAKNQTQVNLVVRPNPLFPILFVLLPVFCLVSLFTLEQNRRNTDFYLSISLIIFTPIVLLVLSKFSKKRLKDRFVNYFHLEEII